MQILTGHTSQDTAFLQDDYPFGFTLRCQRRVWLEYRPKHGYRLMTQTTNPKRPGLVWNKPKASTYAFLAVMYLDEQEHVQWATLHQYAEAEHIEAFATLYAEGLQGKAEQAALAFLRAVAQASAARRAAYLASKAETV